jgi:hypothetical protein
MGPWDIISYSAFGHGYLKPYGKENPTDSSENLGDDTDDEKEKACSKR